MIAAHVGPNKGDVHIGPANGAIAKRVAQIFLWHEKREKVKRRQQAGSQ